MRSLSAPLFWLITLCSLGCREDVVVLEDEVVVRLRECDLITDGEFHFSDTGERALCRLHCMGEMTDCLAVERVFCDDGLGDDSFNECLSKCYTYSCDFITLPQDAVCDGLVDCPGGNDEEGCGDNWLLSCDNETILGAVRWCDGRVDCSDQSDELSCEGHPRFDCQNGSTVASQLVCNGRLDCVEYLSPSFLPFRDGSDELSCPGADFFSCGDGSFIELSQICDARIDCEDGSDESLTCAVRTCPRSL